MATKLDMNEILQEGAEMEVSLVDFDKRPDLAALFEDTRKRQEALKKLKEIDEEQLKMVVQL